MTRTTLSPSPTALEQALAPRRHDGNPSSSASPAEMRREAEASTLHETTRRDAAPGAASTPRRRNGHIIDDTRPRDAARDEKRNERRDENERHARRHEKSKSDEAGKHNKTPRHNDKPRSTRRTDTMRRASTPSRPSPQDMGGTSNETPHETEEQEADETTGEG